MRIVAVEIGVGLEIVVGVSRLWSVRVGVVRSAGWKTANPG
jgi:hypothetical protein